MTAAVRRLWRLLTGRGRTLLLVGLAVLFGAMAAGQRDVMRLGLLLAVLPLVALVLVHRARLRLSCERAVEPAQVPLGMPMTGRVTLHQEGRLPGAVLLLEDQVPAALGNQPRFEVDRADTGWRRVVEYPLLGGVRGRWVTGPLRVRTTDPFGLVQLDRQFVATSEVLVTPEIVPLPALGAAAGGGSTGEARPQRVGVVGQDDVLVREYRQGDDVRRIHWRSTARRGDLMVRREEQAWDPSASLLLDSRAGAHAGRGVHSSLEWAVSAAASIGLRLLDDGFGLEIYEAAGPLHIAGSAGQHSTVSRDLVVERLTELRPRSIPGLEAAAALTATERPGQLVVAVLGRLSAADAVAVARARRHRAQGLALLLDVAGWQPPGSSGRQTTETAPAARVLREHGWRVVEVTRGTGVAAAWSALEVPGVAA